MREKKVLRDCSLFFKIHIIPLIFKFNLSVEKCFLKQNIVNLSSSINTEKSDLQVQAVNFKIRKHSLLYYIHIILKVISFHNIKSISKQMIRTKIGTQPERKHSVFSFF